MFSIQQNERPVMKKLLPLFNLLAFVGVLAMNYLATALPIAGRTPGEVSDMFPNLFAPAGFTFAIWGVIYLLLAGFAIYQVRYLNKPLPVFLEKIGWLFVLSCAANATWLLAWHHLQIGLAMLIMLVILGSLLGIYLRLGVGKASVSSGERWFVHLPFSVYLGWITVATIANATILLVSLGWNGEPPGAQFWAVLVIAAALAAGLWALLSRRDFAFTLVGAWALWGIYQKRIADTGSTDSIVETAAIAGMVMLAVGILYRIFKRS
jgi:hypothetical protein